MFSFALSCTCDGMSSLGASITPFAVVMRTEVLSNDLMLPSIVTILLSDATALKVHKTEAISVLVNSFLIVRPCSDD